MDARHRCNRAVGRRAGHDHRELIPTKAANIIAGAQSQLKLARNGNNRFIPTSCPGVVDRLEVIDIDEQYRRLSMAATAGLKFVTQQRFPVTAIEHAGHSVAGTHQLKPTLMLCRADRRAVAEPCKQHGVDHQHGERQPQRQRFRGQ